MAQDTDERPRIRLTSDITAEIVDPHNIQPVFADIVTELRFSGDMLHLSLANVIVDGADPVVRKVQVCARLRISGNTVRFIQESLSSPAAEASPSGQTLN